MGKAGRPYSKSRWSVVMILIVGAAQTINEEEKEDLAKFGLIEEQLHRKEKKKQTTAPILRRLTKRSSLEHYFIALEDMPSQAVWKFGGGEASDGNLELSHEQLRNLEVAIDLVHGDG